MINVENVTYTYMEGGPFEMTAVNDISLQINEGEFVGLIGHTGSGKSTLVQMLNGLLKPDSGRVLLDGEDIWANPKEISRVRFRVGFVMQYPEYQLFEETVRKDIAYGPKNMGMSDDAIAKSVELVSEIVGLDKSVLDKSPFDLSGGQKRRAAIAGVMAMEPEVLVLDEPAAGLDPEGRSSIFAAIADYRRRKNATVIIVSHSMEDMAQWCDNLVVMSGAKVFMSGTKDEVFARASELASVGLDIPEITRLMMLLKERGFDVDVGAYTVDSAVRSVKKLFGEKNQ